MSDYGFDLTPLNALKVNSVEIESGKTSAPIV